jgi:dTDP-4-dehydrorhamnose reductase
MQYIFETPLVMGYGRLGKELVAQTKWNYISRDKNNFDFRKIETYSHLLAGYNTIINCIANTNTYLDDKKSHVEINFDAVCDLVNYCNLTNKKLIHISTDQVYAGSEKPASETDVPVIARTWYAYSKLLADDYIETYCNKYLIFRTSFKPFPFEYPFAITSQIGNFDYINRIASLMIKLINKTATGIYNVGHSKPWTIYEMALETNLNVISSDKVLHKNMPIDVRMNVNKMERFLNEN